MKNSATLNHASFLIRIDANTITNKNLYIWLAYLSYFHIL